MGSIAFVGMDVHKATIAVAVAEGVRGGEVRQLGIFPNRAEIIANLAGRLAGDGRELSFCYEAGPCGYGLQRQLKGLGHACVVVAPSLIPNKPGDRVKTDRRDALSLAKLHRAGELTPVWVPDAAHEAMRDLIRARATAVRVLSKARQHLQGFLLRHGRLYAGRTTWTLAYRLVADDAALRAHPAQQIVLQDYLHAIQDAEGCVARLAEQITTLLPSWSRRCDPHHVPGCRAGADSAAQARPQGLRPDFLDDRSCHGSCWFRSVVLLSPCRPSRLCWRS